MPGPLTSPNYPRAPITEAVIQLRMAADVEARLQEKVVQKLKSKFPNSQPMHEFSVVLDNTGGNVSVSQNTEGFRLSNDDQTDIILINNRGITATRLAPYPGWGVLRDNAKAAWGVWTNATPRHPVERLGVRFINRIDIPSQGNPQIQLGDYLHFHPTITAITPQPMLGYVLQVVLPTFDADWTATITSTMLGPAPIPNHTSILLDIDIARSNQIPLNDEQLWPIIEGARIVKNDLFERCITDATRKLFAL